ncbi:Peptidase S8 S53 subtilisin kexin sedolisin [Fusarium albosuccineum]|uniref:Peptidase S8 S53 subtilisin kexin sedolisin n=1 Tax=Fusarium albosuccineum TaxID=1237068 RepID=A0A8H4PF54_9HYPO|nr:Peptidase S8 S53 subtilisin kexin sedolisin [Fusarium albosuccineum]
MSQRRRSIVPDRGVSVTSIREVLNDAKGKRFVEESECREFKKRHAEKLDQTGHDPKRGYHRKEGVLNELADRRDEDLEEYHGFLSWACQSYPGLLTCVDVSYQTPLDKALGNRNDEFVDIVLKNTKDIASVLSIKESGGRNCLHHALFTQSPHTKRIIIALKEALPAPTRHTGARQGSHEDAFTQCWRGMTPLRMAVEEDFETPYQNEQRRYQEIKVKDMSEEPTTGPLNISKPSSNREPNIKLSRISTNLGPLQADLANKLKDSLLSPMPGRESNSAQKFDVFHLPDVVRLLIEAKEEALLITSGENGLTPFRGRLAYLEERSHGRGVQSQRRDAEKARSDLIEKDEILRDMRAYIVEKFERKKAIEALYQQSIDANFLDGLRKVLRFEGFLKYVTIPRLTVKNSQGLLPIWRRALEKKYGQNEPEMLQDERELNQEDLERDLSNLTRGRGKGLEDMCDIFRWLKEGGVSSVLKLTVFDNGDPPHSDEAIEECVGGLNVRVWNWFKVDLCADVILKSAPNVKHLTLYSSGNNAVLKSWSSRGSLPSLKKIRTRLIRLETLQIILIKCLENDTRLKKYKKAFQEEMIKNGSSAKLDWRPGRANQTHNPADPPTGDEINETRWMQAMTNFSDFLQRASESRKDVRPVKIAIIDDGIDHTLDIFQGRIKMGESFHQVAEKIYGRWGALYVPSGTHGTLMAKLICKICPKVDLYIAQLEVYRGHGGRRSFSAESAAEAINWAVSQKVDIISMSWFIKALRGPGNDRHHDKGQDGDSDNDSESDTGGRNNDPTRLLKEALNRAVNANIVMFCPSIDEGATNMDKTYPGANKKCIKIGASSNTGARLSWVSADSHFLIPGDSHQGLVGDGDTFDDSDDARATARAEAAAATEAPWAPGSRAKEGAFGSSVATALAAGLAGSLLFSRGLVSKDFDSRRQKYIQRTFKNLSQNTGTFLQVWDHVPGGDGLASHYNTDLCGEEATAEVRRFVETVKR